VPPVTRNLKNYRTENGLKVLTPEQTLKEPQLRKSLCTNKIGAEFNIYFMQKFKLYAEGYRLQRSLGKLLR
jgi:hypothetical protein